MRLLLGSFLLLFLFFGMLLVFFATVFHFLIDTFPLRDHVTLKISRYRAVYKNIVIIIINSFGISFTKNILR